MLQHPTQPYMKHILQPLLQDAVLILYVKGAENSACPVQAGLDLMKYSVQVHLLINLQ